MFLSKIQELHHHSQKPFIIKCMFSILFSIILITLLQPKWCFHFQMKKDKIESEIIPWRIFLTIIVVSIALYFL